MNALFISHLGMTDSPYRSICLIRDACFETGGFRRRSVNQSHATHFCGYFSSDVYISKGSFFTNSFFQKFSSMFTIILDFRSERISASFSGALYTPFDRGRLLRSARRFRSRLSVHLFTIQYTQIFNTQLSGTVKP